MRVILDTNILISGILGRGPPFKIVIAVFAELLEIAFTAETYREFEGVLMQSSKLAGLNRRMRSEYMAHVTRVARFVTPEERVVVLKDDPDNRFLEAALAFDAEYVVSGDKPLLELAEFRGIRIVPPRTFLNLHMPRME